MTDKRKSILYLMRNVTLIVFLSLLIPKLEVRAANVETAISWAVNTIANDDSHGYSWDSRWGPDYDCSSLVYSAFRNAGFNIGNSGSTTYSMVKDFTVNGEFEWITNINFSNTSQLQRGDILLNQSSHTEIYLGNNQMVGAHHGYTKQWCIHSQSDGKYHYHGHYNYGEKQGDQGGEISVVGYSNSSRWQGVLRYKNTPPLPTVHNPKMCIDSITAGNGEIHLEGWAFDEDDPAASLEVQVYIGGEGHGIKADKESSDVNGYYKITGRHRFNQSIQTLKTGTQNVDVFAINIGGGSNTVYNYSFNILLANTTQNNVNFTGENINSNGNCYAVSSLTAQASGYISIPSSVNGFKVHRVAREVFKSKTNITGVYIQDGCYRIGSECFMNCTGLQSIRIPNSLTEIGTDVFKGCTSLKHIFYDGDESSYKSKLPSDIRSLLESTGATIHYDRRATYSIPGTNVDLSFYVEESGLCIVGCNLEASGSITVPGSIYGMKVNRVALHAFDGLNKLTELIFSEGLTRIGQYGLANCPELKKVVLPRSLLSLGITILSGCDKLEKVFYCGARAEFENVAIDGGEIGASCGLTVLYDMAKSNGRTLADGDYHIVTKQTGIGLDITGGSTANNTNVQVYKNAENDDQVFHVKYLGEGYYKITSRKSGLSLDVEGGSLKTRANVQMHTDNGTSAQQWIIKEADDNYNYYIIAGCNGQALDVADGLFQNGTNVRTWEKNQSDAQKWHFIRWNKDVGQTVADGDYRIISVLDHSLGLNVEGASAEDGANINIRANTKDDKQIFHISYAEDGFYTITNKYTGTGLYASGANPYRGNNITVRADISSKSMRWGIGKSVNGSYYNIYCQNGGGYVDIDGGIAAEGRNVKLWGSNWGAGQDWILIPDEVLELKTNAKDMNVTLSWNNISWSDSFNLTIKNEEGTDYSVGDITGTSYEVQLPVGKYTASVNAASKELDYVRKSSEVSFETTKSTEDQVVNDISFEDATYIFDGKEKNIFITQTLPKGVTVEYKGNGQINAGTYTVTAHFFDSEKKLLDVKYAKMVINPKPVEGVSIHDIEPQQYSGEEIKPHIEVIDGKSLLTEGIDFNCVYADNKTVGTAKVNLQFIGNYKGEKECNFPIVRAENTWVSELKCRDTVYGKELSAHADAKFGTVGYRFSDVISGTYQNKKPTNIGTYYVKAYVEESENYTALESEAVAVEITKATYDFTDISFEDARYTYDGEPKSLSVKGQLPLGVEVVYEGNDVADSGEYMVTAHFSGDANHEDMPDLTARLTVEPQKVLIPVGYNDLVYNGEEQYGIWESEQYSVISGGSATEAGQYEATVRLNDKKNYIWEDGTTTDKRVIWTISNAANEWIEELSCPDITYGETPKPSAKAKYGKVEYTYSKDAYEAFSGKAPKEAGTYFVRAQVKESGEYSGLENIMEFTIKKAVYDMSDIDFNDTSVSYDGRLKNITVRGGLPEGVDVTYEGNGKVNAGTYEITASFTEDDNYESIPDRKATLTILPKKADDLNFGTISDRVYSGRAMEPEIDVVDDYIPLAKGIDYDVDYKDNTDAGTAVAVVTLKGNYEGSKEIPFIIRQAKNSWKTGLSCGDISYGETPKPTAQARFGNVKYVYCAQEEGEYSGEVPKKYGTWFVKAMVEGTGNYSSLESEPVQFNITAHKHFWDEGKTTKEPACTESGTRTFTCKECGDTRTEVIPATGHTPVKDPAVEPTEDATGLTEGSHCSVCGEVMKKQEILPAIPKKATGGSDSGHETPVDPDDGKQNTGKKNTEKEPGPTKPADPSEPDPSVTKPADADHPAVEKQEKTITAQKGDGDLKGSDFHTLSARVKKSAKTSNTLTWTKVKGASGYIIYGNQCGSKYRFKKLAEVKGTTWNHKKLKKGTYYKYLVVAYKSVSGGRTVLASSKTIHAATAGGKVGNCKKLTVNKSSVTIKRKKTFTIKAKEIAVSKKLKIKKHRKIAFESGNPKIATVSASGKVKGLKKGSCKIYVYAQNGVYKVVNVRVK